MVLALSECLISFGALKPPVTSRSGQHFYLRTREYRREKDLTVLSRIVSGACQRMPSNVAEIRDSYTIRLCSSLTRRISKVYSATAAVAVYPQFQYAKSSLRCRWADWFSAFDIYIGLRGCPPSALSHLKPELAGLQQPVRRTLRGSA